MIQQPVFLRVDARGNPLEASADHEEGKLTPHRMVYPSFWGRMVGDTITPMLPQTVLAAGVGEILGEAPDAKEAYPMSNLTKDQIAQVLTKLAGAEFPAVAEADAVTGTKFPEACADNRAKLDRE